MMNGLAVTGLLVTCLAASRQPGLLNARSLPAMIGQILIPGIALDTGLGTADPLPGTVGLIWFGASLSWLVWCGYLYRSFRRHGLILAGAVAVGMALLVGIGITILSLFAIFLGNYLGVFADILGLLFWAIGWEPFLWRAGSWRWWVAPMLSLALLLLLWAYASLGVTVWYYRGDLEALVDDARPLAHPPERSDFPRTESTLQPPRNIGPFQVRRVSFHDRLAFVTLQTDCANDAGLAWVRESLSRDDLLEELPRTALALKLTQLSQFGIPGRLLVFLLLVHRLTSDSIQPLFRVLADQARQAEPCQGEPPWT